MKNIFTDRRKKFGKIFPSNSAIVISGASTQYRNADSSYAFRQDSNFWYLTGFNEAESTLVILINDSGNTESIAFVPEKDKVKEIWDGHRAGPKGAIDDYGFDAAVDTHQVEIKSASQVFVAVNTTILLSGV